MSAFARIRAGLIVAFGGIAFVSMCVAIAMASFPNVGSPIYIFATQAYSGTSVPPDANDPASFNTQAYGGATPPASELQAGTASDFDGTPTDMTASGNQPTGVVVVSCAKFTNSNGNGCAAPASLQDHDFIAVQSWPFYVGGGSSSNILAGTFNFATATDDGSWLTLAGAPFTYAQPGNFNNTTALTAGTAVVNNGGVHSAATVYSSMNIPTTGQCATNLYYLTMEYLAATGGQSQLGFGWQPPGTSSYELVTMGVLWGQVLYNGAPDASATVKIPLPSGGNAIVTTDANGCYGYNFAPTWAGSKTITNAVATDTTHAGGLTATKSASVPMGCTMGSSAPCATYLEFDIGKSVPNIVLYKRITKVVSGGVTSVPTPDPGPTGLAGTTHYAVTLKTGDLVTYTIYFTNAGSIAAQPAASSGNAGPTLSDVLPAGQTLQSATAATCCANPTTSIGITATTSGNTATWKFAAPLPTSNPHSPTVIQGNVSVTGKVN